MANDSTQVQAKQRKYPNTLLLCAFLGGLGAHRYYTGYIGLGILQLILCLCGGIGAIWVFIDLISLLMNKYKDANGQALINYDTQFAKGARVLVILLLILGILCTILFFISLGALMNSMPAGQIQVQ